MTELPIAHARELLPMLAGGLSFYVTGEDALRVRTFASSAETLSIEGRFLDAHTGQIRPFGERHVPNADRTVASNAFPLGQGWLLSAQVRSSNGGLPTGRVWAVLEVVRGRTGAAVPLATLARGYVTGTEALAWPGMPHRASTDGRGWLRSITGTDPAVNTEIVETVPTNARWRLIAMRFSLVTDANAANRIVRVIVDDGSLELVRHASGVSQVASTTILYTASTSQQRGDNTASVTTLNLPIGLMMAGGWRIQTSTVAIQAGDNYSAPQLLVEEWIED